MRRPELVKVPPKCPVCAPLDRGMGGSRNVQQKTKGRSSSGLAMMGVDLAHHVGFADPTANSQFSLDYNSQHQLDLGFCLASHYAPS